LIKGNGFVRKRVKKERMGKKKMSKVLVTGGAGFIGSNLKEILSHKATEEVSFLQRGMIGRDSKRKGFTYSPPI
jgi:nucleoside-diphosphate-sugar epimerase